MTIASRLVRLLREELTDWQPRKLVVEQLGQLLPHLRCNYLRTSLWRSIGARIGQRSRVMGPLHVTGSAVWRNLLEIGSDSFVSGPLWLDVGAPLHIGNHVYIGHDVMLLTVSHELGPTTRRCGPLTAAPITIGDGAWLASRCVVLPGVSIGAGSVVAAGAVVTRDVEPDCLVAGQPARLVHRLESDTASSRRPRLEDVNVPLRLVSAR